MTCPACRQLVKASHPDQFREHLRKCAPDAVSAVAKDQWRDVAAAVDAVEAHEATLLEDARRLSFRDGRTREEVADELGVSPDRVRSTLRRASRAVPLVADPTPLDVIHEDDDVLVVNKPPGLRFHPVHRFEGNSLLSRAIGHVRRQVETTTVWTGTRLAILWRTSRTWFTGWTWTPAACAFSSSGQNWWTGSRGSSGATPGNTEP